nr:unnamed protein product [Callosobruchus analis]
MATYNDLAILRLDEGLKIDENQTRVVLPTQVEDVEAKFKDRPLHMTRYCSSHNTIEFKDIFPQDRSSCSHPYNKVSFDRVFCALFQEERKTKFKDSNDMGGPVVSLVLNQIRTDRTFIIIVVTYTPHRILIKPSLLNGYLLFKFQIIPDVLKPEKPVRNVAFQKLQINRIYKEKLLLILLPIYDRSSKIRKEIIKFIINL